MGYAPEEFRCNTGRAMTGPLFPWGSHCHRDPPGPLYYSILLASFLWELHYDTASQSTNVWNSISNPLSQVGTVAWAPYYLRRQGKYWTQTGMLRLEHKTETKTTIRVIIAAVAKVVQVTRLLNRSHASCLWSQGSHRSVLTCLQLGYQQT